MWAAFYCIKITSGHARQAEEHPDDGRRPAAELNGYDERGDDGRPTDQRGGAHRGADAEAVGAAEQDHELGAGGRLLT